MDPFVISLVAAFVLSVATNVWAALRIGKLREQVRARDDTIDDLNAALGGSKANEDWRNAVL